MCLFEVRKLKVYMFLHILNEDQKLHFFSLALRMILTDGEIRVEEIGYLNQLVAESGIPGQVSLAQSVEPPDLTRYDTHHARLALATELMIIAHVDNHVHEMESALFKGVITEFDISDSELVELQSLAVDCAKQIHDGNKLINT